MARYDHISFVPPQGAQDAAKRALEVRAEKPASQRGMTDVGLARARDISNGATLSPKTVRRMKAYFDRHQSDKTGDTWDEQGKGWQAWNGWGGDAGYAWARKVVRQMNAADKAATMGVEMGATLGEFAEDDTALAAPTGVAVMLPLPADVAALIALPDALPASALHVTLAYLPDLAHDDTTALASLRAVVERWALDREVVPATLSGLGRFTIDDEEDALYLSVDAPRLAAERQTLVEALDAAHLAYSTEHGFTPHVTLTYLDAGAALPLERAESRAVTFDRVSIWRGDAHDDITLATPAVATALSAMPRNALRPMAYGPAVALALSALPTDAPGGPWTVIAYEVELKGYKLQGGGHARITAADIDAMVRNFGRYPKVPIVIEHADTREGMPSDWAEPKGWIVDLRRGSMERTVNGRVVTVATLEARLDTSDEMRLAIVGDAENGVTPTWPFCSITPARATDDETGDDLGTVLWSVSLTAHPRLADLPRLAAGRDFRMKNKTRGAANGAPLDPNTSAAAEVELGYWYGEIKTRGDVLSMLRSLLDLPVAASEADTLAALDATLALSSDAAAAAGIEVCEIMERVRCALRLPVIDTATSAPPDVAAKVREALASLPADAPAEMSRGPAASNTAPKEGPFMKTFLELAAAMKLPAVATEDTARDAVMNLARDGAAVRATLGLAGDIALAPHLADLVTASAELPKAQAELSRVQGELKTRVDAEAKAAAERAEVELSRRVDEVCLSKGWADDVKPALMNFGRTDRAAFDAKYPAPSAIELSQRAQDSARLAPIELNKTPLVAGANPAAVSVAEEVAKVKSIAIAAGEQLTELEAFGIASRMTSAAYARQLGVGADTTAA